MAVGMLAGILAWTPSGVLIGFLLCAWSITRLVIPERTHHDRTDLRQPPDSG
jgi:hypothetical protein